MRLFLQVFLFLLYSFSLSSQDQPSQINENVCIRINEQSLETCLIEMKSETQQVTLHLYGMVHIADAPYYDYIQTLSEDYDYFYFEKLDISLVLNEMKKKNSRQGEVTKENPLKIDRILTERLSLIHQKNRMKEGQNWKHADANAYEFLRLLQRNQLTGEHFFHLLRNTGRPYLQELEAAEKGAFDNAQKKSSFRKKFAGNLVDSANQLCLLGNQKTFCDILIFERNRIALEKMDMHLKSETPSYLALIYGAAHIPDFIQRLKTKYKFKVMSQKWIRAWDLNN